jgi:hypothetical protein
MNSSKQKAARTITMFESISAALPNIRHAFSDQVQSDLAEKVLGKGTRPTFGQALQLDQVFG